MNKKYNSQYLRKIRNNIKISFVINVILKIQYKSSDGYFRFKCPICNSFDTAVNEKTNLARCFKCKQNFNNIDIVMKIKKCSFLKAIDILKLNL